MKYYNGSIARTLVHLFPEIGVDSERFPVPRMLILLYHIISYHIISYHIISYHIISYHIISYHIISYHIISYHIISYHTNTNTNTNTNTIQVSTGKICRIEKIYF